MKQAFVLFVSLALVFVAQEVAGDACKPIFGKATTTTTSITVNWDVDCAAGATVGFFQLRAVYVKGSDSSTGVNGGSYRDSPILSTSTKSYTFEGLAPGQQYEVTLKVNDGLTPPDIRASVEEDKTDGAADGTTGFTQPLPPVSSSEQSKSSTDTVVSVTDQNAQVGDPHIMTIDGLTATYLGSGDFVLMHNSVTGFTYHVRHCVRGNAAGSSTCAVAVKCSKDAAVAEIHSTGSAVVVKSAGKDVEVPVGQTLDGQGFKIVRESEKKFVTSCSVGDGEEFALTVFVQDASGHNYLDTTTKVPELFKGQLKGLAGEWDDNKENDIAFRDGRVYENAAGHSYLSAVEHPILDEIQQSWAVTEEEKMFTIPFAEDKQWTAAGRRRFLLSVSETGVSEVANKFCESLNLSAVWHKACVFDYIATGGDEKFARNVLTVV